MDQTKMKLINLKSGDVLSNQQLFQLFKCGNSGGLRYSSKYNLLVIVLDHTKTDFNSSDRWVNDTIYYTGQGKLGNQKLSHRYNPHLYNSNKNGITLHFFEVFKENEYIYHGIVKLIGEPIIEKHMDKNDQIRDVYIFLLKPIQLHYINESLTSKINKVKRSEPKKLDDITLKERAENYIDKKGVREYIHKVRERSDYIREYALRRANGVCQLCHSKDGFLEVHHVDYLRNDGKDEWYNVVGVCPNCHRKIHNKENLKDIEKLKKLAKKRWEF